MDEEVQLPLAERLEGPHHDDAQHPTPPTACLTKLQRGPITDEKELAGEQRSSPFARLPRTVIEHILFVADANTFASLALLNRKWRRISDSTVLYSHHLTQCPSFSLTQKAVAEPCRPCDLSHLKQLFCTQIRRNAFETFLRPRRTLIKLISTSMSSSTAFPQGEAFRFSFSPNGQLILCISSSRIVVLDVTSNSASVKHELKTWRRPLHAAIADDGSLLAVVSSSHRVNIYSLCSEEARLVQDLTLNDVPRTLALSPTGGVLAIAYDDSIEVHAIGEGVLATERRAVRCSGVDAVSFSSDGAMLLGTSADPQNSGLVTISVPFYAESEPELSLRDVQRRMWTTQILFPDVTTGFSRACMLPLHSEGEGSWILGFDEQINSLRAFGANNTGSGTIYFVTPMSDDGLRESPPIMLPTVDAMGELVAAGFEESGLWVYGIPDRLDIAPVATSARPTVDSDVNLNTWAHEGALVGEDCSTRLERSLTKPKVLIKGHKVSDMPGMTAAHWVECPGMAAEHRRLVAVAPGGISPPTIGEEDVPVDGGRVLLLDFARSASDGNHLEISIEVGDAEPKMLSEPDSSLATEVELERRRTRIHRANATLPRARAFARESYPSASSVYHSSRPNIRRNSSFFSSSSNGDAYHIPESPYDNTQPRSRDTLRRAATAVAHTRERHNPQPRNAQRLSQTPRPVPQAFQVPHESDADNWVPPPPPYSRVPDAPLPEYLRTTLLPSRTEPITRVGEPPADVRRSQTSRLESMAEEAPSRGSLQRLNSIAGVRLASRLMRNSIREPDSLERVRRPTSIMRRRKSSATGAPPNLESQAPLVAPLQEAVEHQRQPQLESITDYSVQPSRSVPLLSTDPSVPQSNPQVDYGNFSLEQPLMHARIDTPESIPVTPEVGNNRRYSISSPNLRVSSVPQYDAPEVFQGSQRRPSHPYRMVDRRFQSQEVRSPVGDVIQPLHHRASTDPTLSASSQAAAHDLWRRRIEEWNEQTIYERSKRRSKCIVM
ncbi:F-box domain protein [Aspergillus saccharolyticus JOP 1030-1]|uniref:F-box domain protein n=1 Tax=Aspergillus saccharolyticus JOP 1030-1 TaxID=1450539 RepID=A0A318ZZX5_9EURO|nr:F-box domain protein [Aspergillus saccharolyticus JOP 1030-1]PYH40922.1 F-box domain protein [Aspergillus saccharolyticus JOP 1030-1]